MLNRNLVVKSHKSIYPFVGNMVTVIEDFGFIQENALHLVVLRNLMVIGDSNLLS